MPISADPNDTVPFTLAVDKDKPGVAPFKLRFLTVRQRMTVDRLTREAGEEKEDEAANPKLDEVLKIGVVNLGDFPDLDDVLTIYEKWELVNAVVSRTAMEELDRKKRIGLVTSDALVTGESVTSTSPS